MPITDRFGGKYLNSINPLEDAFSITPNDSADVDEMTRAIMVGVAGDVSVITKAGTTITLAGLQAGVIYPIRVSRVRSTGTTATGIVGLV